MTDSPTCAATRVVKDRIWHILSCKIGNYIVNSTKNRENFCNHTDRNWNKVIAQIIVHQLT